MPLDNKRPTFTLISSMMKVQLATGFLLFTLLTIRANSADIDTDTKLIRSRKYGQIVTALPISTVPKSASLTSSNGNGTDKNCTIERLNECTAKIPAVKDKIPTTEQEVSASCRSFRIGMNCVEDHMQKCMTVKQQQQVNSSVGGAHQLFTFLCKDQRFREEFLFHAPCFKRISKTWDNCAAHFILAQKKVDQRVAQDSLSFCCIRLRFLSCVTEAARLHCTKDAEHFLQKIAETLVPNVKVKNASKCHQVTVTNCSQSSGGSCSLTPSSMLRMKPFFLSIYTIPELITSKIYTFSKCAKNFLSCPIFQEIYQPIYEFIRSNFQQWNELVKVGVFGA